MSRQAYPRPQWVREKWKNLNGTWLFAFDDEDIGQDQKWYKSKDYYPEHIQVPFVYQSDLSGINSRERHDVVWYYREFSLDKREGKRYILHFGAVDYESDIYVNGQHVFNHCGGHTSFEVDVTAELESAQAVQQVSVRVYDPLMDESIPRGKQFWEETPRSIWYTQSTGIWQTVWLEEVNETYIQSVKQTPKFDDGQIMLQVQLNQQNVDLSMVYTIRFDGEQIAQGKIELSNRQLTTTIDLVQERIFRTNFHGDGWAWTPENPNLFDIQYQLVKQGEVVDRVDSYFGMRKIHTENGMVYLNNKPYYQKLVLDQGYWPEGLLTAPSDEAFADDIRLAKEMGFNGCRKHQKTEDPCFLYWADRLGFLVWGESASAVIYNNNAVNRQMKEWAEIIERDYNHPSIVSWVPLNESWGVPNIVFDRQQQHFSQALYHYVHSVDTTRLVIGNDGWAMTETDIVAIHNYQHGQVEEIDKFNYFKDSLSSIEGLLTQHSASWQVMANQFSYDGQPLLLTEFGGVAYDVSGQIGWGYTVVNNQEDFVRDYGRIMKAVYASPVLWGYCYTQLTDVEQEINGLLTYERQPKCDMATIKAINEGYHPLRVSR